jgi:hypothetical protein
MSKLSAEELSFLNSDAAPTPTRRSTDLSAEDLSFLNTDRRAPSDKSERFMTGLADPIIGAAQVADRYLVNPIRQKISPGASSMEDYTRERDANYVAPEGVDWMRMGGNVANPINYVGGTGLARTAGAAAIQAGLDPTKADLTNEEFLTQKGKGAASGAITGAVLHKALAGMNRTPEAQRLMDEGIQPTVGQAKGGWANRMEEKMGSMPFVGEQVAGARRRPLDEFAQNRLNDAVGREGVQDVRRANQIASDQFEAAVPHLNAGMPTLQHVGDQLAASQQNPRLTNEAKRQLGDIVSSVFEQFHASGPRDLKHIDSVLAQDARAYSTSQSVSEREMGRELQRIRDAFREGLAAQSPPWVGNQLREANQSYARMVPINKAASSNAEERIMPRALEKAIARQQGRDVTRSRIPQVVSDAVDVLPNKVPDSGTAGRLNMTNILKSVYALPLAAVTYPASTRTGQAVMLGNTGMQRRFQPHSAKIASTIEALRRDNEE